MRALRLAILLGGFWLAACSPAVTGQVFFDADRDGQPDVADDTAPGVQGILVELYRIDDPTQSGGNAVNTTPVVAEPAPVVQPETTFTTPSVASISGKALSVVPPDEEETVGAAQDEEIEEDEVTDEDESEQQAAAQTDTQDLDQDTDEVTDEGQVVVGSAIASPAQTSPPADGVLVETLRTNKEGKFAFRGITPGKYQVRIADTAWQQGYTLTSSKNPITVKALLLGGDVQFGVYRQGLELVLEQCPEVVPYPQPVICQTTYKNTAPAALQDIALTVAVPKDALEVTAKLGGEYHPALHQIRWHWDTIAPDEQVSAGFVLLPAYPLAYTKPLDVKWQVSVGGDASDMLTGGMNVNLATTADLELAIDGPKAAAPGQPIPYTVHYQNTGTRQIDGAMLTVQLPAVAQYLTSNGTYHAKTQTIVWKLGALLPGDEGTKTFSVRLPAFLLQDTLLGAAASLAGTGLDQPVTATWSGTTVTKNAGLSLQVKGAPLVGFFGAATPFTWTAVLKVSGSGDLAGAVLTATLDAGLALDAATSADGVWNGEARTVTWALGTLAAGEERVLAVSALPAAELPQQTTNLRVTFALSGTGLAAPVEKAADVQVRVSGDN